MDEPGLREEDVAPDPFAQFERWYTNAREQLGGDADAMIVATAAADGTPSARVVLLRGVDHGFCFYTSFTSRKGDELAANQRAAIVWHWREFNRQVRAVGAVEFVSDAQADAYWSSRPLGSRWSAAASEQSRPIATREELEGAVEVVRARDGDDPPRPSSWGGYRVVPEEVEFWLHRDDRLHDRLRYRRAGADSWSIERLQP